MLLCLDIGNTNIVVGVFNKDELTVSLRLSTNFNLTADEYGFTLKNLLTDWGVKPEAITGIVISNVVPPLMKSFRELCEKYFHLTPLEVGLGIKTGMPVLTDQPGEVGADLIAGSLAAYEFYGKAQDHRPARPVLAIDYGTATTFCAVSRRGEYLGVAITPGILIAAQALYQKAAKLPEIDLVTPSRVIGRNTVQSMQSGVIYGFIELSRGLIRRFKEEMGEDTFVVATGGLCGLVAGEVPEIFTVRENLVLEGLKIIYRLNRS